MIINGKTGAQQWIENFHRQRTHTLLTRIKQVKDFVNALYSVIIEIKLQTLEMLPVKRWRQPGETPALSLSVFPMVNISLASCLKTIRCSSNLNRYYTIYHGHRSSIDASLTLSNHIMGDHTHQNVDVIQNVKTIFPYSFLTRIYRGDRIDNFRVLNPVLTRIFTVNRLVKKIREMTPAAVSGEGRGSLSPVQGGRVGENLYMYDNHPSAEGLHLKPRQNREPVPFAFIREYAKRRQAPAAAASIDTNAGPAVISPLLRIHKYKYTANQYRQNIYKMISNALFTGGYKPTGRFSPGEMVIIPAAAVSQRRDIHYVDRAAREMEFKVDGHTQPRHREQSHEFLSKPVPAAVEMVTKKIKKIEKQIDMEEVEKTIYRKVSEQVDQTVRRDIDKRLAFQSRDTRQLTETIYSRLLNRIVLEKERLI
jgi:hypothetical protein